jgi:chromate transporter
MIGHALSAKDSSIETALLVPEPAPEISLREATRVWARIGLLSFGGPAGQIALMHRELVEERKWISDGRFLHALNYCMLLPGPEAQQLATYIGWLLHRTWGGLIAGGLFVLPGFVTILALSFIYGSYGQIPLIGAVFFGLKAAALAVVLEAVIRIGKRALKTRTMMALAAVAFVAIHFLQIPFPVIIFASAAVGLIAQRLLPSLLPTAVLRDGEIGRSYLIDRLIAEGKLTHIVPNSARTLAVSLVWIAIWALPIILCLVLLGPSHVFTQLDIFFSKAATVTFGGAYSVLAYIAQQAVDVFGWVTPGEMMDGLALAETTPGPLIMVVQFVGYLAAFRFDGALSPVTSAVVGSVITTWVTFAPCFLWIFVGAPYIETLIGNRWLHAALSCITAAVVGVVLNLSIWFAVHAFFGEVGAITRGGIHLLVPKLESLSIASLVIAAASMLALLRFHFGVAKTLAAAASAGVTWKLAVG